MPLKPPVKRCWSMISEVDDHQEGQGDDGDIDAGHAAAEHEPAEQRRQR